MSVAALRQSLGLTQVELARIVGVHPLTISKWERGVLEPTPWQAALLGAFRRIPLANRARAGKRAALRFAEAGAPAALFVLLEVAHTTEKP